MFQTFMSNSVATSSRLIQVETKPGLALRPEMFNSFRAMMRSYPLKIEGLPVLLHEDRAMGEKTYLVDFKNVFQRLVGAEDAFYFYPHELEGFIESCVMATQREVEVAQRDIQIYRELNSAMADWIRKEEEASWYGRGNVDRNYSVEEHEISEAMRLGAIVDDLVHEQMELIRDAHGDYAIDERSLKWTRGRALKMRLRF